jgi:hypothetical protein
LADPEVPGEDPGFAPADLTDGRLPEHWETRWCRPARRKIGFEAGVLFLFLALIPFLGTIVWIRVPEDWLGVSENQYRTFATAIYSALGGLLGGTLFSMKWLYHCVAKGIWNIDRRLWRFLTPLISAGVATAVMSLVTAEIWPLLDIDQIRRPAAVFGLAFVIGYFSDQTLGALAQFATKVLGPDDRARRQ